MTIRLFLFDLDGTLVDTAPDLALAVNMVRTARGIAPLPEEELRPYASRAPPAFSARPWASAGTIPPSSPSGPNSSTTTPPT